MEKPHPTATRKDRILIIPLYAILHAKWSFKTQDQCRHDDAK